jgi:hypothetical protein
MIKPGIVVAAVLLFAAPASDDLGRLLAPGMQLVYRSGGVDTPWQIDSVEHNTAVAGRTGCVRLSLRMSPTQRVSERRVHCTDGITMTTWDSASRQHRPARPLGGRRLDVPRAARGVVRFDAEAVQSDTVSGIPLRVVPTTVTTIDASGRVIRRLRERFAIELATATYGVFEVPDSSGWRIEREFRLVAVRR